MRMGEGEGRQLKGWLALNKNKQKVRYRRGAWERSYWASDVSNIEGAERRGDGDSSRSSCWCFRR